jgi:hypothetical protein
MKITGAARIWQDAMSLKGKSKQQIFFSSLSRLNLQFCKSLAESLDMKKEGCGYILQQF